MSTSSAQSIKQHIESHLHSPDLCVGTLCARSGRSRATLYRLFEAEGGLVCYIQRRRLQQAFVELVSAAPRRRILDIALDSHFASEATFNRAFRRMFGLPPGEARRMARRDAARC